MWYTLKNTSAPIKCRIYEYANIVHFQSLSAGNMMSTSQKAYVQWRFQVSASHHKLYIAP